MKIYAKTFVSNLEAIVEKLKELPEKLEIEVILDGDLITSLEYEPNMVERLTLYSIRE